MASYTDVDALIDWIGNEATENAGGAKKLIKPAMTPTMLFPFAAPRVGGELSDAGARAEMEMRVLLWSVERLIGGLSKIGYDSDVDTHLHVVLPGSPNRGTFGGDGAYGEAKASLIAVVNRWKAERNWAERVTLAHAVIGWVRGTGLMGHNDPIVDAVEAAGVRTWSTQEMATQLLKTATRESRRAAAEAPLEVDLTGGLSEANLDLGALAKEAAEVAEIAEAVDEAVDESSILALPAPARIDDSVKAPSWPELDVTPADLVVIVGAGELGPTVPRVPASRWRSTSSSLPQAFSNWRGTPDSSSGRTTPSRAGTTSNPVTWYPRRKSPTSTMTQSSSVAASVVTSTRAR